MSQNWSLNCGDVVASKYSNTFQSFDGSSSGSTAALRPGSSGDSFMGAQSPLLDFEAELAVVSDTGLNTGLYNTTYTYNDPQHQPAVDSRRQLQHHAHYNINAIEEWNSTHPDRQPMQNLHYPQDLGSSQHEPYYNTNINHRATETTNRSPKFTLESLTTIDNGFFSADASTLRDLCHDSAGTPVDPTPQRTGPGGSQGDFVTQLSENEKSNFGSFDNTSQVAHNDQPRNGNGPSYVEDHHFNFANNNFMASGASSAFSVPADGRAYGRGGLQQLHAGQDFAQSLTTITLEPAPMSTPRNPSDSPEADSEVSDAKAPKPQPKKTTATETRTRKDTDTAKSKARKLQAAKPKALKGEKEGKKNKFVRRGTSKYPEIKAVMSKLQDAADTLNARPRSDVEPALYPHPPSAKGLYFNSVQAAEAVHKITYWAPPANDDTVPTTQTEIEDWVVKILSAIRNNQGCLKTNDGKDSASFTTRWLDDSDYYPPEVHEVVAWKLTQMAIDIHQQGWLDAMPEPKLRGDIYCSMLFSFEERMELVEKVLCLSKPTCEDLIKGNRLHEIVGCPQVVFERIIGNNRSNKDKAGLLAQKKAEKNTAKEAEEYIKPEPDLDGQKRKRSEEDAEGINFVPECRELDEAAHSPAPKKRQKRCPRTKSAVIAGLASSFAFPPPADVDTPLEMGDEHEAQQEATDTNSAVKLTAFSPATTDTPAIAESVTKKGRKPAGSKRTIDDIEGDDIVTAPRAPTAKKAKTGPRPKATIKVRGKAKSPPATSGDDSEFEQPSRGKGTAAVKAPRVARKKTRHTAAPTPATDPAPEATSTVHPASSG